MCLSGDRQQRSTGGFVTYIELGRGDKQRKGLRDRASGGETGME